MSSSITQTESAFALTVEQLEVLYDMTSHPGWDLLMAQADEAMDTLDQAVWGAETPADLRYFKGQKDIYSWLKLLRQATRNDMDELANAEVL